MILPADDIDLGSFGGPKFEVGQTVQHRSYGYRGLIVARDLSCQAPDDWYYNNKSQPKRDQPWYHVLVHASIGVTYAAQENLKSDAESDPILHPLLDAFFDGEQDGRYLRNERPWPGWKDA